MTETTYGIWSQAMKARKQHKHVTLRLTKDEARCLIVLAGQLVDVSRGLDPFLPYMADQYRIWFNSLEDKDDETTS
jgi:hypothetical protein